MLKIILILTFLSFVSPDCPLNPYPRLTRTGALQFQYDNDPTFHSQPQNYKYALSDPILTNSVSVATSISGIELNCKQEINVMVETLPTTQKDVINFRLFVKDDKWGWKKLKFNFFASGNSDLFKISSLTSTKFSIGLQQGRYAIYSSLPNMKNFKSDPIVNLFISGIYISAIPLSKNNDYQALTKHYKNLKQFSPNSVLLKYMNTIINELESMQFKILNSEIIDEFLTFSIQTNCELLSLRYSYIIFNKQRVSQKHQYVTGIVQFDQKQREQIQILSDMGMLFTGLTQFQLPRNQNYEVQLEFQTSLEHGYLKRSTNMPQLKTTYGLLGIEMKRLYVCQDCPDSSNIIYQNRICVQSCPRGYSIAERLGNYFCDLCDIDKLKVINKNTGICECANRHFWSAQENKCKPCKYDCLTCTRQDICETCDNNQKVTKRSMNRGRCQCPLIGFYDDRSREDIVCQRCHSSCETCSGPRSHDCLTCIAGKQLNSQGHCICSNNYFEVVPGVCICPEGNRIFNGFCISLSTSCGENQIEQFVDIVNRCACAPGAHLVRNSCIKCPQHAIFNEKQLRCECKNQTVEINGQCLPCGNNQEFQPSLGLCVCKKGSFERQDGSCAQCPPKMSWENGKCQCIFNYYEQRRNVCKRCVSERDGPRCRRNVF